MTDPLKHPGLGRVCGVVLAGGLGRRMGATLPKALVPFRGRPMIDHVLDRLRPQVDDLIINANEAGTPLDSYGADRVADRLGGPVGGAEGEAVGAVPEADVTGDRAVQHRQAVIA